MLCCCGTSPAKSWPSPPAPGPMGAGPMGAGPMGAGPMGAGPMGAGVIATPAGHRPTNTAAPAVTPRRWTRGRR
ncbi:MAG: hypothetical protein DLM61_03200 [Pseudonocardiales bacterium]|nr:MAG: hypothetical protein DLM61_03200 [Pseudonocardiales bacterium]